MHEHEWFIDETSTIRRAARVSFSDDGKRIAVIEADDGTAEPVGVPLRLMVWCACGAQIDHIEDDEEIEVVYR